jgi:hypothetical protein
MMNVGNGKAAADCMGDGGGPGLWDMAKEISGYNDFTACFGHGKSCGWAAFDAVTWLAGPVGKAAKFAKLGELTIVADTAARFTAITDKLPAATRAILGCYLKANSFAADTPVLMADGSTKPIQDIKVGDVVEGTDTTSWTKGPHKVTDLIRHTGRHRMVDVTVEGGATLHATDQHPFWDATVQRFVFADDLKPGDSLRTPDGQLVRVQSVDAYFEVLTAYNTRTMWSRATCRCWCTTPAALSASTTKPRCRADCGTQGRASSAGMPTATWCI